MEEIKLTPGQVKGLEEILARTAERIISLNRWNRNCLNCQHFAEGPDTCQKWRTKPPARVILTACEAFEKLPF